MQNTECFWINIILKRLNNDLGQQIEYQGHIPISRTESNIDVTAMSGMQNKQKICVIISNSFHSELNIVNNVNFLIEQIMGNISVNDKYLAII